VRRGTSGLNLLLGIDKSQGMTSHDVVNRVRRALGERRVGHAGTLDPAATGVMVVGVGQGTRLMGLLTAERKSYLAGICFGAETDTDDAEGRVVREAQVGPQLCDEDYARTQVAGLAGEHDQVPPQYSAISVGGKRAYAMAREGQEVELQSRHITIYTAQLLAVLPGQAPVWQCAFEVSKGTYIRSIARDLGRSLGCAAHLGELRRTTSGVVTLADCVTLERLEELGAQGVASCCLDPVRALGLPVRLLADAEVQDAACGRALRPGRLLDPALGAQVEADEGQSVALVHGQRLLGVWHVDHGRLRTSVNFPSGVAGVRQ
jgi:tRNA pseudouridine55 synthase